MEDQKNSEDKQSKENTDQLKSDRQVAPPPTLQELMTSPEELGNPVKLPDWGGFWFKTDSEVLVFTKEGQILNTPWYDKFGESKEYSGCSLTPELATKFLKTNRIRIDEIMQKVALLPANREVSLAKTSLQTAFMWCGLLLNEVGADNPYPKSMDATSPVIEKHTDLKEETTASSLIKSFEGLDDTALTKTLRLETQRSIDILRRFSMWSMTRKSKSGAYPVNMAVDRSLVEAKMWLGQQLNNIRIQKEVV